MQGVEADLLQHMAKCTTLVDLDLHVWCKCSEGDAEGGEAGAPSLLLKHVPALTSCTRLVKLKVNAGNEEEESSACSAQELLEPLASLPALQEASAQGGAMSRWNLSAGHHQK